MSRLLPIFIATCAWTNQSLNSADRAKKVSIYPKLLISTVVISIYNLNKANSTMKRASVRQFPCLVFDPIQIVDHPRVCIIIPIIWKKKLSLDLFLWSIGSFHLTISPTHKIKSLAWYSRPSVISTHILSYLVLYYSLMNPFIVHIYGVLYMPDYILLAVLYM